MATATATINVRLNAAVKERGDQVLRDQGISTSQAVRGLWNAMARTHSVPDFLLEESTVTAEAERNRRKETARSLRTLVPERSRLTSAELDDLRFRSLMAEYEGLS